MDQKKLRTAGPENHTGRHMSLTAESLADAAAQTRLSRRQAPKLPAPQDDRSDCGGFAAFFRTFPPDAFRPGVFPPDFFRVVPAGEELPDSTRPRPTKPPAGTRQTHDRDARGTRQDARQRQPLPTGGDPAAGCGEAIVVCRRAGESLRGYLQTLCPPRMPNRFRPARATDAGTDVFPQAAATVRRSIQTQILLPFSVTIVAAVAVIAITSSWLAVRQAEQRTLAQLRGVGRTLDRLTVPFTESVLRQMQGLSGADFVALDRRGRVLASTLTDVPGSTIVSRLQSLRQFPSPGSAPSAGPEPSSGTPRSLARNPVQAERSLSDLPVVEFRQTRFLADQIEVTGPDRAVTLIVLYPEADWRAARQAALWPPLLIGAITIVFVFAISALLARSFGRRVRTVRQLLAAVAAGEPSTGNVPREPRDELDDLVVSASQLAAQLESLQQTVQQTERVRLLGQLAGGLAHQLRNAVTGARLAVQLHQKRCSANCPAPASSPDRRPGDSNGTDESLAVALRQLALTEDQIQRLLSLSRQESPESVSAPLSDLMAGIEQLIRPHAEYAHVELAVSAQTPDDTAVVPDAERFRAAVMNLLLNAMEAAGAGGHVWLDVRSTGTGHVVTVSDDGPGPPPHIVTTLFDPFVTSRPEGVGLGLALARQVAQDLGGDLTWSRQKERTVFEFFLTDPGDTP